MGDVPKHLPKAAALTSLWHCTASLLAGKPWVTQGCTRRILKRILRQVTAQQMDAVNQCAGKTDPEAAPKYSSEPDAD